MSETTTSAAERVRAFLDRWTAPGWLGRDNLLRIDEHELTIADLRAVLDEREAKLEAERDEDLRVVRDAMDAISHSWKYARDTKDGVLNAAASLRARFADRIAVLEARDALDADAPRDGAGRRERKATGGYVSGPFALANAEGRCAGCDGTALTPRDCGGPQIGPRSATRPVVAAKS